MHIHKGSQEIMKQSDEISSRFPSRKIETKNIILIFVIIKSIYIFSNFKHPLCSYYSLTHPMGEGAGGTLYFNSMIQNLGGKGGLGIS